MLTKAEIEKKILSPTATSFIHLRYGFTINDKVPTFLNPTIDSISDEEKLLLQENLNDNRLVLTVGKLGKVVTRKSAPRRMKYGSFDKIFDLDSDKKIYFLKPNESITILTNEWVHLDNETGILIFSKVSKYVDGLIVTASFVDPQWKGMIQLAVTNHSSEYRSIQIGDPIASAFFFKLTGAPTNLGEGSAENAKHYKTFWKKLIDKKEDPFETTKTEDNPPPLNLLGKYFTLENIKKYTLRLLSASAFLWIVNFFYDMHSELTAYKKDKSKIEVIDSLKTNVDLLFSKKIESGDASIIIEQGKLTGETEVFIPRKFGTTKILIENLSLDIDKRNFSARLNDANNGTTIKFWVILEKASTKPREIKFDYFVISN